MAAPFKILDQFGRVIGSNVLHDAARPGRERPAPPRVDRDSRQNMSQFGYRQLLAGGRYLYANCPELQNAVNLQAEMAIGNAFLPEYYGRNKNWGLQAEALLTEWHKIMDVRGGNFDWQTNLKLWLKSRKRDGDVGILLTESSTGFPLVQTIPGHRIGSWMQEEFVVSDGPYVGMDLRNGVISDPYNRAVAYRVYDSYFVEHRDISASTMLDATGKPIRSADMRVFFRPDWADQGRGLSQVASGLNDFGDIKQVREFLKMALKKEASFAVVEHNEDGEVDTTKEFSRIGPQDPDHNVEIYQERVDGGLTRIFKANTGSKIEFPTGQRPSEESQMFWDKMLRSAFQAIGWPVEFFDAGSKGGAAIRLIMELAQPEIEADQAMAQKIASWIDGWRIAKAIKNVELPPDPDWWMIAHQGPAQITADRGYSAQIDREDFKIGFESFKSVCSRRGKRWEKVRAQQQMEILDLANRASELVKANPDLTFEMALNLLQQRSPNLPSSPTVTEKIAENGDPVPTGDENDEPAETPAKNKKKK